MMLLEVWGDVLILFNDFSFVEVARAFAASLAAREGETDKRRLDLAFRHTLGRNANAIETHALQELLNAHRAEFAANPTAAKDLYSVGNAAAPPNRLTVETAAWTSVTRAILNLDETLTRP